MATVASLTRKISALDISSKNVPAASSSTTKPTHSRQPSQPNVAKLLTKFAAPNPPPNLRSQQPDSAKLKATSSQSSLKPTSSQSSLRNPSAATNATITDVRTSSPVDGSARPLDIGKYDGGLENDEDRRGTGVSGEAAKDLALDSRSAL